MNYNKFIIVFALIFSYCLCDITEETRANNDENSQPDQEISVSDGNEQNTEESTTSNEEVIPIPGRRNQPSAPCVGCSSYVNPQAAGVDNLANLGVRHLNFHDSTVKHSLESVIEVERQVQVLNGVRYILTLSVNFDNCTEGETDTAICASNQICKITILEKPWQISPSGTKYRAILANNCTEEWLFGDDGEVLPEPTDNNGENDQNNSSDGGIKAERIENSESLPNQEKTLTVEEMKALEQQIIPHDVFGHYPAKDRNVEPFADNADEIKVLYPPWPEQRNIIGEIYLESRRKRDVRGRINNINGNKNKDQAEDATNPKYHEKAGQALIKFSRKNGTLHRVVDVNHVTKRVVSGIIYSIDFTASPTDCFFNVSKLRERNCKILPSVVYYCHAESWEQPWLHKTKLDVECESSVDNDDDDDSEKDKIDPNINNNSTSGGTPAVTHHNTTKAYSLAERALEKFVSTSNRKFVFKIVEILSSEDELENGVVTKLEFTIAPTVCLRNSFGGSSNSCDFKNPIEKYNCKAKVKVQAWLDSENEITVHCKKLTESESGKRSMPLLNKYYYKVDNLL